MDWAQVALPYLPFAHEPIGGRDRVFAHGILTPPRAADHEGRTRAMNARGPIVAGRAGRVPLPAHGPAVAGTDRAGTVRISERPGRLAE